MINGTAVENPTAVNGHAANGHLKTVIEPKKQTIIEKYAGKTVVAVGAHPDDVELGAGGTLKLLAEAGADIVVAVVSCPSNLKDRVKESDLAARIMGGRLDFLYDDKCRRVEDLRSYELVQRIDKLVRDYRPAALITHGYANFHKDHVLVHEACSAAQRLSQFDFYCYHPTSRHPIALPFTPQAYVDITDVIEIKMKAIYAHSSQFNAGPVNAEFYRDIARDYGRLAGCEYAEALEVKRLRLN